MLATFFFQRQNSDLKVHGRFVRSRRGQGIEHVRHGKDPCGKGNVLAFEPLVVAGPVKALVVSADDLQGIAEPMRTNGYVAAVLHMLAHFLD